MIRHAERLNGVKQVLADVVRGAAEALPFDVLVIEGLRSQARQAELWAQGRTIPGKKVTWIQHSKHQDGEAVDLAPLLPNGAIDWNTPSKFDAINGAMVNAGAAHGVGIRWGADWDQDGKPRERGETDSPHFELA